MRVSPLNQLILSSQLLHKSGPSIFPFSHRETETQYRAELGIEPGLLDTKVYLAECEERDRNREKMRGREGT